MRHDFGIIAKVCRSARRFVAVKEITPYLINARNQVFHRIFAGLIIAVITVCNYIALFFRRLFNIFAICDYTLTEILYILCGKQHLTDFRIFGKNFICASYRPVFFAFSVYIPIQSVI